jgi:hypothetical protein
MTDETPQPGQIWRDREGTAHVLAVVLARKGSWTVVLERVTPKASRPFVVPQASLLSGFDGWRRES